MSGAERQWPGFRHLTVAVKIAVSIALLVWVFRQSDVLLLSERFTGEFAFRFAVVTAVQFALALPLCLRWWLVLRAGNRELPFGLSMRLTLVGKFFNQCLPTSIGGDAYRVWQLKRLGMDAKSGLASVIVDRLLALISIAPILLAALVLLPELGEAHNVRATTFGVVLLLLVVGAVVPAVPWLIDRLPLGAPKGFATVLETHLDGLLRRPMQLLVTIVLSAVIQLSAGWSVWFLASYIDNSVSFVTILLLMPLVIVITLLPASINGWGLRESAIIGIFAWGLEMPQAALVAGSLGYGLAVLVSSLPGLVVWLFDDRE